MIQNEQSERGVRMHDLDTQQQETRQIVAVVDLGPGNEGNIGPSDSIDQSEYLRAAGSEYKKPASNRWRCGDGRCICGEEATEDSETADPQIFGGYVIADNSADLMLETMKPEDRHSVKIAKKTQEAVEDGIEVVVHGDNNIKSEGQMTNPEGCAANLKQREALRRNAENADAVIPKTIATAKVVGIDVHYKDQEGNISDAVLADRTAELIDTGRINAENDRYWDADAAKVVDTIVPNGGTYQELDGPHAEGVAVVDCKDGAFDGDKFRADSTRILADGTTVTPQAFFVSLGEYYNKQLEIASKRGLPEKWAADKTLAVILQTIGVAKKITAEDFPIALTK